MSGETWGSPSSGQERWRVKYLDGTYWWPYLDGTARWPNGKIFLSQEDAAAQLKELRRRHPETQFRVVRV
jgi:hypothetical protein